MRDRDWDDELLDLDDDDGEADDEIDDGYDEEDEEGAALSAVSARLITAAAVAAALIFAVVVAVIILTGRKSEEPAEAVLQAQELSDADGKAQELPEDTSDDGELDITDVTDSGAQDEQESAAKGGSDTQAAEAEDPQTASMSGDQGAEVDVTELLSSDRVSETSETTIGIDVGRLGGGLYFPLSRYLSGRLRLRGL